MTLPASGAISFNAINVELGVAGTTQANINQASYRTLAGVASGQISLSNFYGKSNEFAFTISSNQTNANLRTLAVNAGWNQSTKVVATISGGVYISSNVTTTPALTINGSFPGGVSLVNNGFIVGRGGAGGNGGFGVVDGDGQFYVGVGYAGGSGAGALLVSVAVTVTNNGTIAGGGGGGGGGGSSYYSGNLNAGGGGGGGRSSQTNSTGGTKGLLDNFYGYSYTLRAGVDGTAGTVSAVGTGGAGGVTNATYKGGTGGNGGGWGSSGVVGGTSVGQSPYSYAGGAGGSSGYAVSGNSNITYIATGTRLGAIS